MRDASLQITHFHCSRVQWLQALYHSLKTHLMKLPMNSYCANIASRGSLELGGERCNRGHSAVLFCELVWLTTEALLRIDVSTSQQQHLQLTGAALAG